MASTDYLNLNSWDGLIPVLLPVGQRTMPGIGAASVGVAVPFVLFVVAFLEYAHRLMMKNFAGDLQMHAAQASSAAAPAAARRFAVGGGLGFGPAQGALAEWGPPFQAPNVAAFRASASGYAMGGFGAQQGADLRSASWSP